MPTPVNPTAHDEELARIVAEEERCLLKVLGHLEERLKHRPEPRPSTSYDAELLSLRDQIATARMEDVPPLLEQMERLQSLANRKRESDEPTVDPRCPYFGRLVLREGDRKREVLIGRGSFLDTRAGIRIVDWRDAPVSRLYYRYEEGDEYDEVFGEREVNGEVLTRRSLTIVERELKRVAAPQGHFARGPQGSWRRVDLSETVLRGGAGTALRADHHHRPGKLGTGAADDREDKHLKEITALIDRRQFELITHADSGLVVIQGGAGSGKTTIGLHRLAYLAFRDRKRFRPERMLVLVYNAALARYVSLVLPALEVPGVPIHTYQEWAAKLRRQHVLRLPREYHGDTPREVTLLKKHPAMLRAIDLLVARMADDAERRLEDLVRGDPGGGAAVLDAWRATAGRPLAHRGHALASFVAGAGGKGLAGATRLGVESVASRVVATARDVVTAWSELSTDRGLWEEALRAHGRDPLTPLQLARAHAWCTERVAEVQAELERRAEESELRREREDDGADERTDDEDGRSRRDTAAQREDGDDASRDADDEPTGGVDGRDLEERARLDPEDDTLLLRLVQRLRGPLVKRQGGAKQREPLQYEHILIDEAQDMSPVELAVVMDTAGPAKSVTLAGDVAQRLHVDNGFSDWRSLLADLGLSHVEVEPLKLSYRSSAPILELAQAVLGPLAPADPPVATRAGVPVEMLSFGHPGDAVAFLAEALRELTASEPSASVAVITRFPEQADLFYDGLRKGEVRSLRSIAEQDFPFKPGVDVTDVRQVKGLEFDYVVLAEVGESSYPATDDARHLLHIAVTRAAHQLWVLCTGRPSPLLPAALLERGY